MVTSFRAYCRVSPYCKRVYHPAKIPENPVRIPWKSCLFHGILWVAPSKDPAASSLATVRCRVTPQRAVPGKSQNVRKEEKAPAQRAAAQRRGNMTELEMKIIKRILEDENAMLLALEFIQKDQESLQAPSADQQAS